MAEKQVSVDDIEAVIKQLRDVKSAKVVMGELGGIEEVHVLVSSSRSAKQIVRDVESAVMARLGMPLDHRKVSVAQIGDALPFTEEAVVANGTKPQRLAFSDVRFSVEGSQVAAHVTLRLEDECHAGSAEGPNTPHQQLRLVSQAALNAIQSAYPEMGAFILEDIQSNCRLASHTVVVCLVNLVTRRGSTLLTGSAIMVGDQWKAAVNATLDAVNRFVGYTE